MGDVGYMGYIDLSRKQAKEHRVQWPHKQKPVSNSQKQINLCGQTICSQTHGFYRGILPMQMRGRVVRRAGFMWCFSSIRQWKSVKSAEIQVPRLVCGVRFCHWVVRLGFMAYCNTGFYRSFCHKLELNESFNNNAGLKHIFLFSLKLHVCLWCLLVHFTGCITVFLC